MIGSLDTVGYSRLVERDEKSVVVRLNAYWQTRLRPLVAQHDGRVVKLTGDGALVEFTSAVGAFTATTAFLKDVATNEAAVPEEQRIHIRAGLHLGEVIAEAGDIFGHGVNIAARLQALAPTDTVCMSESLRFALGSRAPPGLVDLGEKHVRNIEQPVRAWIYDPQASTGRRSATSSWHRRAVPAVAALSTLTLVLAAYWGAGRLEPWLGADNRGQDTSIAVLPFRNLSDTPGQDFFVDGVTEDLIADLSRIHELRVVSRNTAFSYRGHQMSDRALANELRVRYLLQGSVRRQADRVRVSVHLVDAAAEQEVWNERYDDELVDIFDVQDSLKRRIVEALSVRLGTEEAAALETRPTENVKAYELYLRGRHALTQGELRSMRLAYWTLHRSIELAPDFAPAIALLAQVYAVDFEGVEYPFGWERPPAIARAAAERLARRAQEINPKLAAPEIALAELRVAELRFDEALPHAERAVRLEPQLPEAQVILAKTLSRLGRHADAARAVEEAFRLNPAGSPAQHAARGMALFGLGDYPAALASMLDAEAAASVSLNWVDDAVAMAAAGHSGGDASPFDLFSRLERGSISIVGWRPIFKRPEDQARLEEGLHLLGVPERAGDPPPPAERLDSSRIRSLFFGGVTESYCIDLELVPSLRISETGQALLNLRYDIAEAGEAWTKDDQLCLRFQTLSLGRELCFLVYPNDPPRASSRDHPYVLDGPTLCYATPPERGSLQEVQP